MKNCKKIHPLLSLLQDGLLSSADEGKVEAHLEKCLNARQELEQFKRLRQALNGLSEPKMPADLHGKIMARVQGGVAPAKPVRQLWTLPYWGLAAAAIVTIALFVQDPDLMKSPYSKQMPQIALSNNISQKPVPKTAHQKMNFGVDVNVKTSLPSLKGDGKSTNDVVASEQAIAQPNAAQNYSAAGLARNPAPAYQPQAQDFSESGARANQPDANISLEKQSPAISLNSSNALATDMVLSPKPRVAEKKKSANVVENPTASSAPTSWASQNGEFANENQALLIDAESFAKYWQLMKPNEPLPSVDFDRQAVVVLMAGTQPSSGYSIHISNTEEKDGRWLIHYAITAPAPDAVVTLALTHPWSMQIISKPSEPVAFSKDP